MNKILKLSVLPLVVLGVMSCEDYRDTNMVPDGVRLSTKGMTKNVASVSIYDGCYSLNVFKSGKGTESAEVDVDYAENVVSWYNENNGSEYKALSRSSIEISKTHFSFREKDMSKPMVFSWDPVALNNAIGSGEESSYVIPVKIINCDITVLDGVDYVLLNLVKPVVGLSAKDGVTRAATSSATAEVRSATVNMTAITASETIVTAHIDNSLVAQWNAANGLDYDPAPAKLLTLPEKIEIPAGATTATFEYGINDSVYAAAYAGKTPKGVVAPVKVYTAVSGVYNLGIAQEEVFYVVLTPAK